MSSSPRLTELIGIKPAKAQEPAWLLNAVLVLLGAVIVWVAFRYLRIDDARWQYNPWSYAVATPVVLIMLSLLLRTVASRGVERSLQIAFLLSVLLHLLMTLYAGNVVIFTRMWPEIFEQLAKERKMLERQSIPAPRYHNLAAAKSASRPDYLRYVPTNHQPTEVKDASESALQLAKSATPDLVSPTPEVSKSASPHLVPREKSQLPPPQANDQVAALSRSKTEVPRPELSSPQTFSPAADSELPAEVQPAELPSERRRSSGAELRSDLAASAAPRKASEVEFNRREVADAGPLADTRIERKRVPDALSPTAVERSRTAIDVPDAPVGSSESAAASLAANDRVLNDSRSVANAQANVAEPTGAPKIAPSLAKNTDLARRSDRAERLQIPQPAAGDLPSAFARDSAGGRTSPAAPRSLPIQGPDALAMQSAGEPDLDSAFSSLAQRNSQIRRSTSGASELGLPQSSIAANEVGLSSGTKAIRMQQCLSERAMGKRQLKTSLDLQVPPARFRNRE